MRGRTPTRFLASGISWNRLFAGTGLVLAVELGACGGGGSAPSTPTPTPNPVPSIATLSPSSTTAGTAAQALTINGSGFLSSSSVTYGGVTHTATFVNSGQLTTTLSAGDQGTAGANPVVVTNPTPGGGASNSVSFTVNNPVPSIATLSPSSTTAGTAAQALTINGMNFVSGSTVTYSGVVHTATFVNSGQLTITLSAGDQANLGSYAVVVTNPAPGGGTSGAVNFMVTTPPPTVTVSFSPGVVEPGATSTLTWSTTNATACTASGAWNGSEGTSGSESITQSTDGNYQFGLTCTGVGGNGSGSASLLVTDVKPTSYLNKNALDINSVSIPDETSNAFGLADFFGDGSLSLVLHTLLYNPNDPSTATDYGKIYFYKQDAKGTWVDNTSKILANTTGCLHPRKAVIADFNHDGKPDVFFACHGFDRPPYPGEQPHILLSQPDGTYSNVTLPFTCYCHGASAADITGNGYPDILVTDTSVANTPYFLMNNGDGTFTQDFTRLPASAVAKKQIYAAELIDFENRGVFDVYLAGNEPGTTAYPLSEFGPTIFPNDGTGHFISTTPVSLLAGPSFGFALDVVVENGYIYLLKVNYAYTASEIQKIAYPSLNQSVIYSYSGVYPNGNTWLDWIIPYESDLVSEDASYAVSVPQ